MKAKFVFLLAWLLAAQAFGLTVHVLNPWANTPGRAQLYLRGTQFGIYPGVIMTAEGGGWFSAVIPTGTLAEPLIGTPPGM